MKSAKQIWLGLVLVMITALIFSGCGKKDNPFAPSSDGAAGVASSDVIATAGITIAPNTSAIADLKPDTAGVQGQITIDFPVYMEASTVNLTNITVDNIQNGVISYNAAIKRAVIQGTWNTGAYWVKITLGTGLRGKGGQPIDGNGNKEFDGSPYDNYTTYFAVGAPTPASAPDLVHPKLTGISPSTGAVTITNPAFTVTFNGRDIDSQLVRNNVVVRDSTGRAIALKSGGTAWGGGVWYVYFYTTGSDSILPYNMNYTITVNVNALADTSGNKATWDNYGYIANVPNAVKSFRTEGQTTQDYWPLVYSGNGVMTTNEQWVSFNDSLDMTTVNTTNVKLYKITGPGGSIVSGVTTSVYALPSDLYWGYYFRVSLANAPTGNWYRVYLSRNIKDNAGNMLDGNGIGQPNNIGGEAGDATWGIASDDVYFDFAH